MKAMYPKLRKSLFWKGPASQVRNNWFLSKQAVVHIWFIIYLTQIKYLI